jgi:hypothetical protein
MIVLNKEFEISKNIFDFLQSNLHQRRNRRYDSYSQRLIFNSISQRTNSYSHHSIAIWKHALDRQSHNEHKWNRNIKLQLSNSAQRGAYTVTATVTDPGYLAATAQTTFKI